MIGVETFVTIYVVASFLWFLFLLAVGVWWVVSA